MGAALAADLQSVAEASYPNRVVQTVAFAMLYYDFLLTFPFEVERYWAGGRSWASCCFFVNRYMAVLGHLPVVYEFFGTMPEEWAILSVRSSSSPSPNVSLWVGCDLGISQKQGYYLAAAWSSILAFDIAVFVLTLWQALHVGRTWSHSLFRIILRDGTIYFGVLAICYSSDILTYVFVQPKHKGILTTLTNVLSTTLVTRMMLNIRNPELLERPQRWPSEHFDI
ncbi:hypothetical protein OH76DRAFT_1486712 [Lentinus brumalis]|uniref:DUF6533 domain-containing protein n=1 Tax=Lentinus brumalis TaxID=2498619 RepID=A0A371CXG2_9APHY|nr:hypothetical protein OH76DRAFT_1486712 [Polyporus brumalis]